MTVLGYGTVDGSPQTARLRPSAPLSSSSISVLRRSPLKVATVVNALCCRGLFTRFTRDSFEFSVRRPRLTPVPDGARMELVLLRAAKRTPIVGPSFRIQELLETAA